MAKQKVIYTNHISADRVVATQNCVHPALDWVDGQLIVGVQGNNGERALLSSKGAYVDHEALGKICDKGSAFTSSVTSSVVSAFLSPNPEERTLRIDGLLDRVARHIQRFVAFPKSWMPDVVAVWILATYVYPVFRAFPYLRVTSKEPGCGKSVLGERVAHVGFNGELMTSMGEAHLFRMVELTRGIQVWDEMEIKEEVERKKYDALKAVLLSGYRNGASVPRNQGKNWEIVERFHVYCPRVLIGLSELPETVLQRSITIAMQKRQRDAVVELYNQDKHASEEQSLKDSCVLWALQKAQEANEAYYGSDLREDVEARLGDVGRQADDIWLPLFAVVKAACPDSEERERRFKALQDGALSHKTELSEHQVVASTEAHKKSDRSVQSILNDEATGVISSALTALLSGHALTPTDLTDALGIGMKAQTLSKHLGHIGIRSHKKDARRLFQLSRRERKLAKEWMREHGQEGHLGQEKQEYVEEIDTQVCINDISTSPQTAVPAVQPSTS